MDSDSQFEIKYFGRDFDPYKAPEIKKRSFKRKLLIVVCFVGLLAITPTVLFGIDNLKSNSSKQASTAVIKSPVQKALNEKVGPTPTPVLEAQVQKGDSYWRIAKRNCGSGKYYLTIQEQNDNMPLHQGDNVKILCVL